jgi:carbon monoxide dehydrogenase subunit G
MAGSPYVFEYAETFVFPASPERVWGVLERFETLAATWPWLRELRVEGAGLQRGTVVRGVVTPPLPYRMRLVVVLDECVPGSSINATVHGDLEGWAHITFAGDGDGDGAETRADATWTIEMTQPAMRVAARLAPRVLRWGHDRVVAATVNALRRLVAEQSA